MNLISCILFALIATFTPGPNNITSASMGLRFGYKKTLSYLLGIITGFLVLMLLCSLLSQALLRLFPNFQVYLKYIGALYIGWLAWSILGSSFSIQKSNKVFTYWKGVFLQLVNPKALVFGFTIFGTFLVAGERSIFFLITFSLFLALMTFCAISLWTMGGVFISKKLSNSRVNRMINIILALMLFYSAIDLTDFLF